MAKDIPVLYEGKFSYNILIRDSFKDLPAELAKMYDKNRKICIVTDSSVAEIYLEILEKMLKSSFENVFSFVFEAGEASKNLETVEKLYEGLTKLHFDRNDLLIALGGGVTGDLTGFTASTYMRGIDFIQVPTSLLSQVDSSIGGKTGVDFKQYKNMVGAFYMPRLVYINIDTLRTLPKEQFACGMGEIIKHGLIRDKDYYEFLKANAKEIQLKNPAIIEEMIYGSCLIKKAVVEEDPKEKTIRGYLNFGHTIGHAIEKLSDFKLYHGQCVALGMICAMELSKKYGQIDEIEIKELIQTINQFNLPEKVSSLSENDILLATKSDKKMDGNSIKFIVLEKVGEAKITREITDSELIEAIKIVLE